MSIPGLEVGFAKRILLITMHALKNLTFMIGDLLGVNLLFRMANRQKIRMLMYHGVTSANPVGQCWTVLDKNRFSWQMAHLKRYYRTVSATEAVLDAKTSVEPARDFAVITFDDGLENTYTDAWPVLREMDLTAICFVLPGLSQRDDQIWADDVYEFLTSTPAGEIDLSDYELDNLKLDAEPIQRAGVIGEVIENMKSWPADRRNELVTHLLPDDKAKKGCRSGVFKLMSTDQISQLAASREFEIGIHTDSHPILSSLTAEEQEQEVFAAIDGLEAHDIGYVPIFAYPNGRPQDFNEDSLTALKKLRLRAALTTVDGFWERGKDPFQIPRIPIGADTSRWEFKARMSGFYYFLKRLKAS